MPQDKPEKKNSDKPNKPVSKTQIRAVKIEPQDIRKEQIGQDKPQNHERNPYKPIAVNVSKIPKINIVDRGDADNIARKANNISLASVIVNGLLFICTLGVAYISYMQANSADSAAKIAQRTLDTTRKYDSIALDNQKKDGQKGDDTARLKYNREMALFKLQKTSDSAQVAALQETQKEFDIENKPFFQIIDLKIENIKSNDKPVISYNLKNYGKQPAKLIKDIYGIWYTTAFSKVPKFDKTQYDTLSLSANLGEGVVYQQQRTLKTTITTIDSINIKNGIIGFYMDGMLYFRNIVTNKISAYHYTYKIDYVQGKPNNNGITDTTIEIPIKKKGIKF